MQQIHLAYLLALTLPVVRAVSQYCFKLASASADVAQSADQWWSIYGEASLWLGIVLYIGSFPVLLHIHKMLPLSHTAPLLSTALIWTVFLGVFLLSEQLTIYRVAGIGLILLGSGLIGISGVDNTNRGTT